ncbi:MAG: hypothetical protein ACM3SY_17035 [Candidatus Omnitrophota bacterium]
MHIYFEGTIKNGYIKVPEKYAGLIDQKVIVEILDEEIFRTEKADRVKNIKEFLQSCSGILKHSQLPTDIS